MSTSLHAAKARRAALYAEYKAIEIPVLTNLLQPHASTSWTTRKLVRYIGGNRDSFNDVAVNKAIAGLKQSNSLRRQVMQLWPQNTNKAARHENWINVVEDIINILKVPKSTLAVPITNECTEIANASIASDRELWVAMDFDIFLDDMNECRQKILALWAGVETDPSKLSVADPAANCMLRYMNFEIGVMELTNPEWFTEDGQLREQDIERWVEMNTGLGPTLSHAYRVMGPPSASPLTPEEKHEWDQISSIFDAGLIGTMTEDDLKKKFSSWPQLPSDYAFAPNVATYTMMKHINENTKKSASLAFLMNGIVLADTIRPPSVFNELKRAAVRRVATLITEIKKLRLFEIGIEIADNLIQRCQYLNTFIVRQSCSIWHIAQAFTYCDLSQLLLDGFMVFALSMVKFLVHIYDARLLIEGTSVQRPIPWMELVCNKYKEILYWKGNRPQSEVEWREGVRVAVLQGEASLRRSGLGWIEACGHSNFIARIQKDKYLTPHELGFAKNYGSPDWWQSVRDKIQTDIQQLPTSACTVSLNILEDYTKEQLKNVIGDLRKVNWQVNRPRALEILNKITIKEEWFTDNYNK